MNPDDYDPSSDDFLGKTVKDTKLKGFIIIVVIVMRLSGAVAVSQAQENADSLIVVPLCQIICTKIAPK